MVAGNLYERVASVTGACRPATHERRAIGAVGMEPGAETGQNLARTASGPSIAKGGCILHAQGALA
jgi:hypothetical protein